MVRSGHQYLCCMFQDLSQNMISDGNGQFLHCHLKFTWIVRLVLMDLTACNDRAVLGVSKSLLSGKKIRVSNADEKKDWAEVLSSVRKNSTKKKNKYVNDLKIGTPWRTAIGLWWLGKSPYGWAAVTVQLPWNVTQSTLIKPQWKRLQLTCCLHLSSQQGVV